MSSPGAPASAPNRRQKRMGPAPFASFEDLSDELDSPEDKNGGSVVRLPGIREDVTPCSPAPQDQIKPEFVYTGISLIGAPSTPTMPTRPVPKTSLQTPSAPRIDISRASSSSHHDSKDSSPDREANVKMGLGFREEGTIELRSSTEELDFQDKTKPRPVSPQIPEDSYHSHNRKDSQSSEIGLLCISGRTSRLSSIGSQGSAQSRASNVSHLSVISNQSGVSRSPSPHKMLLETSFCGTKPQKKSQHIDKDDGTKEDMESVLLKRQHDPTQVFIAEGIVVSPTPEKPARKIPPEPPKRMIKSDITINIEKPSNDVVTVTTPKLPKHIVGDSGVEYIYIPLKGPLPEDTTGSANGAISKQKVRETKSASLSTKPKLKEPSKQKSKSASPSPIVTRHHHTDEPKYIRIKLKPDHQYDDKGEFIKPDSLDLNEPQKKPPQTFEQIMSCPVESPQITPVASPRPTCHLKEPHISSKSPSPSLSRKSSFASIFKSRETISPESPTNPQRRKSTLSGIMREANENKKERRRSRSKSRDRSSMGPSSTESIDSKGRPRSVFSLFKGKKGSQKDLDRTSPELPNLEGLAISEKRSPRPKRYEMPLDGDSIRIPLHSPTYYEHRNLLHDFKSSSQDSQETVIEVAPKTNDNRQSSTSSENLVFSTRLGSNNELFTTKLPKDKCSKRNDEITTVIVEAPKSTPSPCEEEVKPNNTESVGDITGEVNFDLDAWGDSNAESIVTVEEKFEVIDVVEETKVEPINKVEPKIREKARTPTSEIELARTKIVDRVEDKLEKPIVVSLGTKQVPSSLKLDKVAAKQAEEKKPQKPEEVKETKLVESRISKSPSASKMDKAPVEKPLDVRKSLVLNVVDDKSKKKADNGAMKSSISSELAARKAELPENRSREDDRYSSESERDSEIDKKEFPLEHPDHAEPERKGLVLQQDSYDDELPYIPTTLPQERSMAVPIIPVKQRSTFEMKTCPIERPRSTTPIHHTFLEDYCEDDSSAAKSVEKLKICLPRDEDKPKVRSPRRTGSGTWFDFSKIKKEVETPPPLPPKGMQKEWINFEEIPERRKPPKRIQTIPSRSNIEVPESVLQENVIYTYVNPEDCKCECHERASHQHPEEEQIREDELPLLEDDAVEDDKVGPVDRMKLDVTILDRRSIVSDSSVDLSAHVDHSDANGIDHSLRTPFTSDLGISSNRSSIISQDDAQSPDTDSPNAFPKKT